MHACILPNDLACHLPSIAQQHNGSRSSVPALPNVRALRFFTDRVQVELSQRLLDLGVARISSCK
jgi:hypothetical protein